MEDDIRDFKDWTWEFVDNDYQGIPLKHVIDMLTRTTDIKCDKECPTPSIKPFFKEFMERGDNVIEKFVPEEGISLPEHWWDWESPVSYEEFRKMPMKLTFVVHLHHTVKDPVPMQPPKTRHESHYNFYFINPGKLVLFIRTEGFDYTFCDRFCPEHYYEFTQSVKDGAMQESNLKKRLSMFTTNIKVKNRLHVMKSLMLFGGTIMKENER